MACCRSGPLPWPSYTPCHPESVCRAWTVLKCCACCVSVAPDPAVLMLTARGEVADRVRGLNLGADDYLARGPLLSLNRA